MLTPLSFCSLPIKRIRHIQKTSGKTSVLIGVKGGGCNGLKYTITPTNDPPQKHDECFSLENTNIMVCGDSLLYILGTKVSWVEDVMGDRFEFENPNAGGTCGCGSTFSPK